MNYSKTLFKFINYSEPRGRLNNLVSSNSIVKQFRFKNAKIIIKNKIKMIERKI